MQKVKIPGGKSFINKRILTTKNLTNNNKTESLIPPYETKKSKKNLISDKNDDSIYDNFDEDEDDDNDNINNFHKQPQRNAKLSTSEIAFAIHHYIKHVIGVSFSAINDNGQPNTVYDNVDLIPTVMDHILTYNNIYFTSIDLIEATKPILEPLEYTIVESEPTPIISRKNLSFSELYVNTLDDNYTNTPMKTQYKLVIFLNKSLMNRFFSEPTTYNIISQFDFNTLPKLHPLQYNQEIFEENKAAFINILIMCDHLATHIIYDMYKTNSKPNDLYHTNFTKYGRTLHTIFSITAISKDIQDVIEDEHYVDW